MRESRAFLFSLLFAAIIAGAVSAPFWLPTLSIEDTAEK